MPNIQITNAFILVIGDWNLRFVCDLRIVIWNFSNYCDFEFEIYL